MKEQSFLARQVQIFAQVAVGVERLSSILYKYFKYYMLLYAIIRYCTLLYGITGIMSVLQYYQILPNITRITEVLSGRVRSIIRVGDPS